VGGDELERLRQELRAARMGGVRWSEVEVLLARLAAAEAELAVIAKRDLCQFMSDISEDCYCAGWLNGLEHALWRCIESGPRSWGQGEITQADLDKLKALSSRCGGWWVWREGVGNVFVPLEAWRQEYEREKQLWVSPEEP
jgi:hypothetical protein